MDTNGRSLVDLYADESTGLCDDVVNCRDCPVYDCCPFDEDNTLMMVGKKESEA